MNAIHSMADWLTQQLSLSLDFAHLQILILPVFTAALEPPKSSASASGPSAGPAERPATASEGVLDAQLVAQFFDSALRFGELKAPSAEELSEEGKDVEALLLQGNAAGGPSDSTHHLVRLPVHLLTSPVSVTCAWPRRLCCGKSFLFSGLQPAAHFSAVLFCVGGRQPDQPAADHHSAAAPRALLDLPAAQRLAAALPLAAPEAREPGWWRSAASYGSSVWLMAFAWLHSRTLAAIQHTLKGNV